jgi:hypothetical protein
MTRKVPLSTEALLNIGGIGEQKVLEHGEHIVATIWSFLQKNHLLHLFPKSLNLSEELPPYSIPDCPTWRDPTSPEAEALRSANSARTAVPFHSSLTHLNSYPQTNEETQPENSPSKLTNYYPPKPVAQPNHGMYTHHPHPGAPSSLVQSPLRQTIPSTAHSFVSPSPPSSSSQSLTPYQLYLQQREKEKEGQKITPQKRSSPSDEENDVNRRRFGSSRENPPPSPQPYFVDASDYIVSPE